MNIQINRYDLSEEDKMRILNGSRLKDTHVDLFHELLRTHSNYKYNPRSTLVLPHIMKYPQSTRLKSVPPNTPHLQLLHSCEDLCEKCIGGHWICSYYDGKSIFIYDSFNCSKLNIRYETFLRKLFPHFDEIPKYFQKVQYQNNLDDCGVFAIAFAISLFFQQNPSQIIYDTDKMRSHLYNIFERKTLIHFPTVKNENPNKHLLFTSTPTIFNDKKVGMLKTPIAIGNVKQNSNETIKIDNNKTYNFKINSIKDTSTIWNIMGLPNLDGISCYVNVSLQTLLHCVTVREKLLECPEQNALYAALQDYVLKRRINITAIKGFAHTQYLENRQEDVAEFLTHLCGESHNLHAILNHELIVERKCFNCNHTKVDQPMNNCILGLCLPNDDNYSNLQDIINFNIDNWNGTDIYCNHGCQVFKSEKTRVCTSNKIIILQFKLFKVSNSGSLTKITDLKLNNLDKETVIINEKHYKIISAVFHHGNSIESGHYSCILRENEYWLRVNDLQITRAAWPINSKDVYLIFLEEISMETSSGPLINNNILNITKDFCSYANEPKTSIEYKKNTIRDSRDIDRLIKTESIVLKNQQHPDKIEEHYNNHKHNGSNSNQSKKIFADNIQLPTAPVVNLVKCNNTVNNNVLKKNNKHSQYYEKHKTEILRKRKLRYNNKKEREMKKKKVEQNNNKLSENVVKIEFPDTFSDLSQKDITNTVTYDSQESRNKDTKDIAENNEYVDQNYNSCVDDSFPRK